MPKTVARISKNIKETAQIAEEFLEKILKNNEPKKPQKSKGAFVVGLSGDLGTGKTAFTQTVAKHLGIKRKVSSPTFLIMKKYAIKDKKQNKNYEFLFHLDAYRLKNEKELLHLGWREIIADAKNLVFIEWPEQVMKIMPKNSNFIHISHTKEGHRSFKIKSK